MIRIQYFGSIRAAAGKNEEELELSPGTTVFKLLEALCGRYGEAFRGELMDGGKLRNDMAVSLNGTMIWHTAADETLPRPGDVLALLPLFPGGG